MTTTPRRRRIAAAVTVLALTALGCGAKPEPVAEPTPGPSLDSPQMGLVLAEVPPPFVADPAAPEAAWVLRPQGKEGTLTVALGPTGEVNLVAAVHQHQAEAESSEGHEYLGAGELAGPLGAVFWSRSRRPGDAAATVEETRLFALHPAGDRQIVITYVYPAGEDSSERVQEAIAVLAELEGRPATAAAP